jgi:uncharacterized membrane protein
MNEAGPLERGRQNITGIVSTLVTGIWLAALMTGQDWWLGFMLFGYVVIVPIVAILFGDEEDAEEWWDDEHRGDRRETTHRSQEPAEDDSKDALETLRDRYARGELTDEQFERKIERLLETETLEDVEDRVRGSGAEIGDDTGQTQRETNRSR